MLTCNGILLTNKTHFVQVFKNVLRQNVKTLSRYPTRHLLKESLTLTKRYDIDQELYPYSLMFPKSFRAIVRFTVSKPNAFPLLCKQESKINSQVSKFWNNTAKGNFFQWGNYTPPPPSFVRGISAYNTILSKHAALFFCKVSNITM